MSSAIEFVVGAKTVLEEGELCSLIPDGKGGGTLFAKGTKVSGVAGSEEQGGGQATTPAPEDKGLLDGLLGLLGDIIPGLGDVLGGGIFGNLLKLLGDIDIGKLTSADKAKLEEAVKSLTAMQTAAQVATNAKAGGAHVGVGGAEEGPEAEE